jgi:hypothetical protein
LPCASISKSRGLPTWPSIPEARHLSISSRNTFAPDPYTISW